MVHLLYMQPYLATIQPLHKASKMNHSMNDNKRMKVEKTLRFDDIVSTRAIEHQRDLTDDHRDRLWYNDDDFERIKSDIRKDVKTAKKLRRTHPEGRCDSVCTLGIEHLLSANALRSRIESKNAVINTVLTEQERLHRARMMVQSPVENIEIPSTIVIARASMVSSLRDRQDAVARAN